MNGNLIPIPGREGVNRIPPINGRVTSNPTELQRRASEAASGMLRPMVPGIANPSAPPSRPGLPMPEPKPGEQISMGQLSSTPDYVTKFLIDLVRKTMGLPEQGQGQFQIPSPDQAGPEGGGGMPDQQMGIPSHGYNVAEGGKPEVVTAPGAYFPSQPGQVIPMEGKQFGGNVNPSIPLFSRQGGGEVEPSEERSYMGEAGTTGAEGRFAPSTTLPQRAYQTFVDPWVQGAKGLYGGYQKYVGEPFAGLTKPFESEARYLATGRREAPVEMTPSPTGTYETVAKPGQTILPGQEAVPWTGNKPTPEGQGPGDYFTPPATTTPIPTGRGTPWDWRGELGQAGTWSVGPERQFMGSEEILPRQRQYPASEGRTQDGDELARQRIMGEIPTGGYYSPTTGSVRPEDFSRLPARTYYEAHPEERYMDMAEQANRPYQQAYLKAVEDTKSRMQGFGTSMDPRIAAGERGGAAGGYRRLTEELPGAMSKGAEIPFGYYKAERQFGPDIPSAQHQRAMANYYQSLAASEPMYRDAQIKEINARSAKEGKQPLLHGTWGVFDPNAPGGGQYYPAPTTEEPHRKTFQDIIDRSYTTDLYNRRVFDEEGFQDRLRQAVKFNILPKNWGEMIPPKSKKPSTVPAGNKEGRYDIEGQVWNWTKAKGWYQ